MGSKERVVKPVCVGHCHSNGRDEEQFVHVPQDGGVRIEDEKAFIFCLVECQ